MDERAYSIRWLAQPAIDAAAVGLWESIATRCRAYVHSTAPPVPHASASHGLPGTRAVRAAGSLRYRLRSRHDIYCACPFGRAGEHVLLSQWSRPAGCAYPLSCTCVRTDVATRAAHREAAHRPFVMFVLLSIRQIPYPVTAVSVVRICVTARAVMSAAADSNPPVPRCAEPQPQTRHHVAASGAATANIQG